MLRDNSVHISRRSRTTARFTPLVNGEDHMAIVNLGTRFTCSHGCSRHDTKDLLDRLTSSFKRVLTQLQLESACPLFSTSAHSSAG